LDTTAPLAAHRHDSWINPGLPETTIGLPLLRHLPGHDRYPAAST